ncbi:MAG: hypothetical protein ABJF10_03225 [Chthoniobacter sp.]|uniref:RCC1 domain-containing protein n=1 Tax=Chthoniobacter sp. TaxID=2510640 RepID=UPI0032AA1442
MNKLLVPCWLAMVALLLPGRSMAAETDPRATGAAMVEKFQERFDADKAYLRRPLEELAESYRQALLLQKEQYTKAGDAAGALAATQALNTLSSNAANTPSEDAAVETLRRKYVDERSQKMKELAPKVQALFASYTEKHKALIASLVERDFTDDALAMAARAEEWRDWMAGQPVGEPYGEEVVISLLAKGTPALSGVVAWGWDNQQQTTVPPKLTGVIAVAGGIFHSLALKYDGTVVAWGGNEDGQTRVPEGLSGVVAIAAGEKHSLALKSDGTVVAWGYNKEKQCEVPAGLNHVKAIASHCWSSIALKTDGTVVAWGRNSYGQLNVPPDLAGVVQISAGAAHNLALKSDGTVVAWGLNDHGQTDVPGDLGQVVAVAAGHFHNLALKADGTVVGWGFNNYGQTRTPRDLSHVKAIAAQGWHSAALTADGQVLVWGFKNQGQTNVPKNLAHASAISSGTYHVLAVAPVKP